MSKGKSVAKIWTNEIPMCYGCSKDNVYYANKTEIAIISRKLNVDISTATSIFRYEHSTILPRVCDKDEYNEWMDLVKHFCHYSTLLQLFRL